MSGEVTMSGEVQRRVSLYKFNIEVVSPGKITIDKISFDLAFGGAADSIVLNDWTLGEINNPNPLYNCIIENNRTIVC